MLPELLPHADHIVIARGDLGNDLPLWELPAAQKSAAETCRAAGKPFMVVTQLLHSMHHSAVPTRAEVCDIFNAVLDGASSLMLTGETAVGEHPAAAMRVLVKTGEEALRWRAAH
ncbi:MAG: pyruvate kinase [Anaerotruncus massiliensis (ex Togo et al. 2019)]